MLQGLWWSPEQSTNAVPGILNLDKNGIYLELSGETIKDGSLKLNENPKTIHGVISGSKNLTSNEEKFVGKHIILDKCICINSSPCYVKNQSLHIPPIMNFQAQELYIFENSTFVHNFSLEFDRILIEFNLLPDFVANSGFGVTGAFTSVKQPLEYTTNFKSPEFPKAQINGFDVTLITNIKTDGDRIRNYTINPVVSFQCQSKQVLSLFDWQTQLIKPLQHFLSLAFNQKCQPTKLTAFHRNNIEVLEFPNNQKIPRSLPTQIINAEFTKANIENKRSNRSHLFLLYDIEKDFDKVLNKWFSCYRNEHSKIIQTLIFDGIFSDKKYSENRF